MATSQGDKDAEAIRAAGVKGGMSPMAADALASRIRENALKQRLAARKNRR